MQLCINSMRSCIKYFYLFFPPKPKTVLLSCSRTHHFSKPYPSPGSSARSLCTSQPEKNPHPTAPWPRHAGLVCARGLFVCNFFESLKSETNWNRNHLRADPLSETSFLLESFKAFSDPPFDDQFHKLIS